MTKARAEHADGRRKLSDAHRAKLAAASRARYDQLTPAEREAQLARIGRKPRGAADPPAPAPGPSTDPPTERRSPLAMTPLELIRAVRGRGR